MSLFGGNHPPTGAVQLWRRKDKLSVYMEDISSLASKEDLKRDGWVEMQIHRRLEYYFIDDAIDDPGVVDILVTSNDNGVPHRNAVAVTKSDTLGRIEDNFEKMHLKVEEIGKLVQWTNRGITAVGNAVDQTHQTVAAVEEKVDDVKATLINIERDLGMIFKSCQAVKNMVCSLPTAYRLAQKLQINVPEQIRELNLCQVPRFFVVLPVDLSQWDVS